MTPRLAFLVVLAPLAACSPGPGDNLVGTWSTQSGHSAVQCFDVPAFSQDVTAGDQTLTVAHRDNQLLLTSSAWDDCSFLALARGPSTADVIGGQLACTASNGNIYLLTGGQLKTDGDSGLAANLLLTTTTKTNHCGRDQSLLFGK